MRIIRAESEFIISLQHFEEENTYSVEFEIVGSDYLWSLEEFVANKPYIEILESIIEKYKRGKCQVEFTLTKVVRDHKNPIKRQEIIIARYSSYDKACRAARRRCLPHLDIDYCYRIHPFISFLKEQAS